MEYAPTTLQAVVNGILLRCPKCGHGKLFAGYLRQNDVCADCGQDLKQFRADDGPAWLTILLTGHIVVPFLVYLVSHDIMPYWAQVVSMFALTTLLVLGLLPSSKGTFIAILWVLARKHAKV